MFLFRLFNNTQRKKNTFGENVFFIVAVFVYCGLALFNQPHAGA